MNKYSKHDLTKELLEKNRIRVEFDSNNQPYVVQEYIPAIRDCRCKWNNIRPIYDSTTKHKYGNDMTYKVVNIKLDGKFKTYTLSNIAWIYCNGNIPKGYDVDHIDGNTFDNSLSNLQLLSREDNLHKRTGKKNQYC